jgi:hypothetical protein
MYHVPRTPSGLISGCKKASPSADDFFQSCPRVLPQASRDPCSPAMRPSVWRRCDSGWYAGWSGCGAATDMWHPVKRPSDASDGAVPLPRRRLRFLRNGSRVGLRIRSSQACVGSSRTFGERGVDIRITGISLFLTPARPPRRATAPFPTAITQIKHRCSGLLHHIVQFCTVSQLTDDTLGSIFILDTMSCIERSSRAIA